MHITRELKNKTDLSLPISLKPVIFPTLPMLLKENPMLAQKSWISNKFKWSLKQLNRLTNTGQFNYRKKLTWTEKLKSISMILKASLPLCT